MAVEKSVVGQPRLMEAIINIHEVILHLWNIKKAGLLAANASWHCVYYQNTLDRKVQLDGMLFRIEECMELINGLSCTHHPL